MPLSFSSPATHSRRSGDIGIALSSYDNKTFLLERGKRKLLQIGLFQECTLRRIKRVQGRTSIKAGLGGYKTMTLEAKIRRILPAVALLFVGGAIAKSQANNAPTIKNVVLVHGGFVDGSGWEGVYNALTKKGYHVTVVQNPTISLADDVAVTKRAIDAQDGPVILVGHSYGGVVISSAGDDPKVVGLVYICAFAADNGDSVLSLIKTAPADAPAPPILPPQDGFLFLDRQKFAAAFAGDVKPEIANFMANSQVPWGLEAASAGATAAAWKTKPSWYLLTTEDHMIAPELQRFMSKRAGSKVVEIKGSHAIYVSHPEAVASIIEQAAAGSSSSTAKPETGN
jgi:pimeloyl-ACP methyl ester carboxylesterase